MIMEARLDKSVFKKQTLLDADRNTRYWRSKSYEERLQAGYHLSLRAYGYDPTDPPRMDKQVFSMRTLGAKAEL
jgi:hypothetical protein